MTAAVRSHEEAGLERPSLSRRRRARALAHALSAATGVFPAPAQTIRRLRNGDEIFPAMLAAIDAAERDIAFVTFVYWTGEIAERMAQALAAAARRGVTVRVVLDAVGADEMNEALLGTMREAGVRVRWFRPLSNWRLWQSSHRTHRKLLIVDGELGFTGGVGIAEEWEGDARDPSQWRDTHFEVRGRAVIGLWGAFTGTWIEAGGELVGPPPQRAPDPASEPLRVHVMPAPSTIGRSMISTALWSLFAAAESSIRVATAYFTPDPETIELLRARAKAGVEIDLLVPGPHNDSRVAKLISEPLLRPLLEAGARVHAFLPTMMHIKLVIVDEAFVAFGSANVNDRSMRKDEEILLAADAPELVDALLIDFAEDLGRSSSYRLDQLRRRPWWRRLLSTLLSPFDAEV